MKEITLEFLEKKDACQEGIKKVTEWGLLGLPADEFIISLMKYNKFDYANWLITALLKTKKQLVKYAVYAAKLVLDIHEKEYPKDNRPRRAIEATEAYLKRPSSKNKKRALSIADDIPVCNSYVIFAAACAASNAAYTIDVGENEAYAAACNAADAALPESRNTVKEKIIKYGLSLL